MPMLLKDKQMWIDCWGDDYQLKFKLSGCKQVQATLWPSKKCSTHLLYHYDQTYGKLNKWKNCDKSSLFTKAHMCLMVVCLLQTLYSLLFYDRLEVIVII